MKNILKYRKPAFCIIVISVIAFAAVSVGLMANPQSKPDGFASVNAIILEIDTSNQLMTVKGIDKNSVIGDNCIIPLEGVELLTVATNSEPRNLSLDAFSEGDYIVLFLDEVQESYPTRAKATVIQLQPKGIQSENASELWDLRPMIMETNKEGVGIRFSLDELTHDQAVALALFSLGNQYLSQSECLSEGHIILGYDDSDNNKTKIYALTEISGYGFENDSFVNVSGSSFPAIITVDSDNNVEIEKPLDGSDYAASIRKMFPKEYHDRIFGYEDTDRENLKQQQETYAREYLLKIGRNAKIGDYSDFEHTSPTDLGVSVEVSNMLQDFYKQHSHYPSFLGNRERLEGDVRMIYELSYHETQNIIRFTKYVYKSQEKVEQFVFDSITGKMVE